MKRTEKDLERLYEESRQLMIGLGYDAKRIPIRLNGRLSSTLGRYFRKANKIEIAKNFFLYGEEDAVRNTIVHEICHQVCKVGGHGAEWKKIANHVSRNTRFKITRLASEDKVEGVPNPRKRERKYIVRCTTCSNEWRYATKSKAYQNPHHYKCPKCNIKNTLVSAPL